MQPPLTSDHMSRLAAAQLRRLRVLQVEATADSDDTDTADVFTAVAQLLMTRAYATGRVLVNASLQYLGIAFSFAYGVLLFDDRITAMALAGMTLIVGAGFAASLLHDEVAKHNQHTTDT